MIQIEIDSMTIKPRDFPVDFQLWRFPFRVHIAAKVCCTVKADINLLKIPIQFPLFRHSQSAHIRITSNSSLSSKTPKKKKNNTQPTSFMTKHNCNGKRWRMLLLPSKYSENEIANIFAVSSGNRVQYRNGYGNGNDSDKQHQQTAIVTETVIMRLEVSDMGIWLSVNAVSV